MILRTGVDLIEVGRVEEVVHRHGARYLERVYTAAELKQSRRNSEYLAGRFAAKEAVAKALGTGIGEVGWQEIEILGDAQRAPQLSLSGAALRLSQKLGLETWSISISHNLTHAIGLAVAFGGIGNRANAQHE